MYIALVCNALQSPTLVYTKHHNRLAMEYMADSRLRPVPFIFKILALIFHNFSLSDIGIWAKMAYKVLKSKPKKLYLKGGTAKMSFAQNIDFFRDPSTLMVKIKFVPKKYLTSLIFKMSCFLLLVFI